MLAVVAFAVCFGIKLQAVSGDETTCVRPRASLALTEAILLKDHIVGVATGRCASLSNCNGHGYCRPLTQTCVCHDLWGGIDDISQFGSTDCSTRTCPAGRAWVDVPTSTVNAHQWAECSNRGICDRVAGKCICAAGFTGSACQRAECPNDCSGNGECVTMRRAASESAAAPIDVNTIYDDLECSTTWDQNVVSMCVCDSSWSVGIGAGQVQVAEFFGPDCSYRHCPSGDDPMTLVDETDCSTFVRNGAAARTGAAVPGSLCHVDCSNRGFCDVRRGICECFEGYYGKNCGKKNALANCPNCK